MVKYLDYYDDWSDIPSYYYGEYRENEYAMNLGKSAAKKCLKRYTDSQILKLIKESNDYATIFKGATNVSWAIFIDEFRHTKEYHEAVDKFTEHIKHTVMKVFGKRRLQKYFGKLSDEKLVEKGVDAAMMGYGDNDIFPYENIDWGFTAVIEDRIIEISKKMKAKKAAVKKQKQMKRKVRK